MITRTSNGSDQPQCASSSFERPSIRRCKTLDAGSIPATASKQGDAIHTERRHFRPHRLVSMSRVPAMRVGTADDDVFSVYQYLIGADTEGV